MWGEVGAGGGSLFQKPRNSRARSVQFRQPGDLRQLASSCVKETGAFEPGLVQGNLTMGDSQHGGEGFDLRELAHRGLPGSATREILRPIVKCRADRLF